ncbi:MAG TPA: hypothetical protein PKE69_10575 [Pyrinomonadaceae bacterium]|nr:hypothetical protein [Pyrinomonadaceae bacterium]
MKNIKNMIAASLMAVVLMVGTSFANGGIIVADLVGGGQCQQQNAMDNGGIIVAGFTGIIVAGFTGIIVADLNANNQTNRNQTVACRDGMLLSD